MSWSHITYSYTKEGKKKRLEIPIKAVHDLRKKRIINVINSKRIERSMPELTLEELTQKKYTQGLLPLT